MSLGEKTLLDLIGSIYDSADNPALWGRFLSRLAGIVGADSAALVMHRFGRETHNVSASWELDPAGASLYQQYYGSIDLWAKRARSKPAGYLGTSNSLVRHEELATTEIFNDFLRHYGVVHGMFGLVENDATRLASLSLYRNSSSDEFGSSELRVANLLVPHVARAFRLHSDFSELTGKQQAAEKTLDMLPAGVIFLGCQSDIISMSAKAEKLVRSKNGLVSIRGRLSALIKTEASRLQTIIDSAVKTSNGNGLSAGGAILISRSNGRPLWVTVSPLRNSKLNLERSPAAVVFISDPDRSAEVPQDLLRCCYGLTAAETRLTIELLNGRSLKETADVCHMTYNTAKSHLKNIFSKTQVQRQGELIKLLLCGCARAQLETPQTAVPDFPQERE